MSEGGKKGVGIRCFEEGVMLYLSDGRAIPMDYDDYSAVCDLIVAQERHSFPDPAAKPDAGLTPAMRAMADFQQGLGQEANPYNKKTQHTEWTDYSWAMHTHWHKEFAAERSGQYEPKQEHDDARPAEPTGPGSSSPPF
jgi:hypothetical protein